MIGPEDFLRMIHGEHPVFFSAGGKTWKNKPQSFRQAEPKLRWRNGEGDDICFVVNGGGTRDHKINRVNALFIEWDAGRAPDGQYLDEVEVAARKASFLPLLTEFVPAPSVVVETRNGFHGYWLLRPGVSPSDFTNAQKRLAAHFRSDSRVSNPSRLMRLPGFDWVKPSSGCARFNVRIIQCLDVRYGLYEVLEGLPALPALPQESPPARCDRICAHNNTGVYNTPVIVGAYPATEPTSVPSWEAGVEHLKRQDLGVFLGLTSGTRATGEIVACPFHQDRRPSAGIFLANQHWLFRCHGCGIHGSIIDIAQKVWGCDTGGAIKRLFDHYQVNIDSSGVELLDRNLALLNDPEALRHQYPHLHRLIGRVLPDLRTKLILARRHVDKGVVSRGEPVFFCSLRHFHRLRRGDDGSRHFNRQNEKVDRYCVLGLLRKLRDDELPTGILKKAREKRGLNQNRVQFYAVPAYTPAVLAEADKRACKWISGGASVRSVSPEMIEALFGKALVAEVYPQGTKARPGAGSFCKAVAEAVGRGIAEKRYTTVREIVGEMRRSSEWKSVTERRVAKCLPGVLASLGLERQTCDAELKQSLGIVSPGYPRVILSRVSQPQCACW